MKNALITGGTGKIGFQIVLHLVRKGFNLAILYNKSVRRAEHLKSLLKDSRSRIKFFQCDLTNYDEIQKTFKSVRKFLRTINLIVNCAGIFEKKNFYKVSENDWNRLINVNFKAPYFINQKFSKILEENSLIINFASVGGLKYWKDYSLYNISKAGVISLTQSLAIELAPKVRVNAIAPGYIEMESHFEKLKMPIEKIPLKKYCTIEDLLRVIDFLVENKSITGVVIPIDGGRLLI